METELSDGKLANKNECRNRKRLEMSHSWSDMLKYRIGSLEESDKDLDITEVSKEFCSRTSSQGVTQVFNAPRGSKKLFWIILTIGALIILTGHLYYVINQFLKFETTTEVTVVPAKLLEFPVKPLSEQVRKGKIMKDSFFIQLQWASVFSAVTVCNNNAVKRKPPGGSRGLPVFVEKFDRVVDFLALNNSDYGHQKEDLIVQATFDNHRVDINEEFTMTMNARYGNCYTFNVNATRSTRRAMPGYGLELLLNIEQYTYETIKYKPVEWAGAVLKIHRPNVEPTPQEKGIPMAPHTLNRIALTKTQLLRKGGLYGNCLNAEDEHPHTYYKGEYTRDHCENTCLQKKVIEKCCCYLKVVKYDLSNFTEPWFQDEDDQIGNWTMCARDDIGACKDNDSCWKIVWRRYDVGQLSCSHCWDTCRETLYDMTVASVLWPTEAFADSLLTELQENQRFIQNLKQYEELPRFGPTPPINITMLKKNFLKVQIYYSSLTTTYITELPAIGHYEFVSEIGGTFGLWIGWTILTAFEFLEFLADLVVLRLCKGRKHNTTTTSAPG